MTMQDIYADRGGAYSLGNPPPTKKGDMKVVVSTTEKYNQAIALLTSIRTDEKIRDTEEDNLLMYIIEILTKLAEGESAGNIMPQQGQGGTSFQDTAQQSFAGMGSPEVPNPIIQRPGNVSYRG